ncbi:hypothetical protein MIND_01100000 [Mycena indigotica]|uniref:Uncharacterized protein n=1 Tax=Mycena indigotica TaxID=2126181 RepID=A0A8H6W161_9AGAR|nr:uncharacterized protein MIND_01100000 [Mycena indigotica]KAF7295599.1 hypothetical protein MIND_01100000 [Mycena indigotica]
MADSVQPLPNNNANMNLPAATTDAQAEADRTAFCPVCFRRFKTVNARNSHLTSTTGIPVCERAALANNLPLPLGNAYERVKLKNAIDTHRLRCLAPKWATLYPKEVKKFRLMPVGRADPDKRGRIPEGLAVHFGIAVGARFSVATQFPPHPVLTVQHPYISGPPPPNAAYHQPPPNPVVHSHQAAHSLNAQAQHAYWQQQQPAFDYGMNAGPSHSNATLPLSQPSPAPMAPPSSLLDGLNATKMRPKFTAPLHPTLTLPTPPYSLPTTPAPTLTALQPPPAPASLSSALDVSQMRPRHPGPSLPAPATPNLNPVTPMDWRITMDPDVQVPENVADAIPGKWLPIHDAILDSLLDNIALVQCKGVRDVILARDTVPQLLFVTALPHETRALLDEAEREATGLISPPPDTTDSGFSSNDLDPLRAALREAFSGDSMPWLSEICASILNE